jgi:hypothetical protein
MQNSIQLRLLTLPIWRAYVVHVACVAKLKVSSLESMLFPCLTVSSMLDCWRVGVMVLVCWCVGKCGVSVGVGVLVRRLLVRWRVGVGALVRWCVCVCWRVGMLACWRAGVLACCNSASIYPCCSPCPS